MTYQETLDYIYAKLPMYQRIGSSAFKKDLSNIRKLCEALGNPQDNFKSIHIAGTNGKGSTCHILSAIYQNNGYKTGLYTSPHLLDFRERIKLNGSLCSKDFVVNFIAEHKSLIEEIQPSFFEITVAMAFSYFADERVDVAIIETGLGGRLDSTNIITPISTAITSIGLDHMDMLGDTIPAIAGEKAGIIKQGVPLVLGHLHPDAYPTILAKATVMSAPIYHYLEGSFSSDLSEDIQQVNIGLALQIISQCADILPCKADKIYSALTQVKALSSFQGRWQIVSEMPMVVCDVAHNKEGLTHLIKTINKNELSVYLILGFVKGKDLDEIIPILPDDNTIHLVKPKVVRGRDAQEVAAEFTEAGVKAQAHNNLKQAIQVALSQMKSSSKNKKSAIIIGGSNFLVADALHLNATNQLL